MYLNPIVKKDIKVQSRSMRICWGIFAYELILALVFFMAMSIIQGNSRYSSGNIYSAMVWLYPVLGVTQLIILGLVVPVKTASSISGEKERQTFDIMMTTSMSAFSVIMGKVMTAIVQGMFFVVASMPVMALSFIIGGMSWAYLFWFLGIALLVSLFSASIGILCSSLCKRSISAVIMSYVFYLAFFLGTAIPPVVMGVVAANMSYTLGSTPQVLEMYGDNILLFLTLNPAVYLTEIFAWVMAGESLVNNMSLISTQGVQVRGPVRLLTTGYWWLICSTILFVGVSFLFLWLASRRIDPIRGHGRSAGRQGRKGR